MVLKAIGNTGIELGPLSLGTVKFGRNTQVKYPNKFKLPEDKTISELLDIAISNKVNVLDTAPAYGSSEERIGKLLQERDKWILSTKVGEEYEEGNSIFNFSAQHTTFSIERSLKRLKTNFLDIVFIHSNGDDVEILTNTAVLETLSKLKSQGKIRAIGISSKTVKGGKLAIKLGLDAIMLNLNPLDDKNQSLLSLAEKSKTGIFIKKAFASGHLDIFNREEPIEYIYKHILVNPAVSSIITGTINPAHLEENILAIKEVVKGIAHR